MHEAPSVPHEANTAFESICTEVQRLYPTIGEIQFFCSAGKSAGKHISFWIITNTPFSDQDFSGVQQNIMARFARNSSGYRCSLPSILQVRLSDISTQNFIGKTYIREVEGAVRTEFDRDDLHILYESGTFIIYGAAPRDHAGIQASLITQIPHTLPLRVEFRPHVEWEEDQNVTAAVRRTNDAFAEVEVPSRAGVFSGVGLTLAQIMEVLRTKISPPN